ncbi:MAG: hypothetical protein OEV62_00200 [Actinomycetota bacterium]|nr:hypothetical protein [Actinomycetota bacterium]
MAAIATYADVENALGRTLTVAEQTRVTALLDQASSAVRQVTGRPFGMWTGTIRRSVRDGRVWLAMRDISAVSAVKTITGTDLDGTWDGMHLVMLSQPLAFDQDGSAVDVVDITLTRSGDSAPSWVVGMVAQMAARAFGQPADRSGIQQETIAGYSYSMGSAAAQGAGGLMAAEEARLRRAFPPLPAVAWTAGR